MRRRVSIDVHASSTDYRTEYLSFFPHPYSSSVSASLQHISQTVTELRTFLAQFWLQYIWFHDSETHPQQTRSTISRGNTRHMANCYIKATLYTHRHTQTYNNRRESQCKKRDGTVHDARRRSNRHVSTMHPVFPVLPSDMISHFSQRCARETWESWRFVTSTDPFPALTIRMRDCRQPARCERPIMVHIQR